MLDPMMAPMVFCMFITPAPTKASTMSKTAELLCSRAVARAPLPMERRLPLVYTRMIRQKALPDKSFCPVISRILPHPLPVRGLHRLRYWQYCRTEPSFGGEVPERRPSARRTPNHALKYHRQPYLLFPFRVRLSPGSSHNSLLRFHRSKYWLRQCPTRIILGFQAAVSFAELPWPIAVNCECAPDLRVLAQIGRNYAA